MGYSICKCGTRKANHATMCRSCRAKNYPEPKSDITEAEIAWVAGILEGEGCWTKSSNRASWFITVSMTDLDTIEKLQKFTGVGTISLNCKPKPGCKQPYYWTVCVEKHRNWLTLQVLPWLSSRRKLKIAKLTKN